MTGPRLRLVFAGTPEFAVPSLEACLAADFETVAVYTQPDRPAGRGRRLVPGPVKRAALAAGVAVEQPESLRAPDVVARLRDAAPDLLVVVAYGLLLPRAVLAIPRLGCWNVHASLLPRWRGAAPIQRALLAGDARTGVSLMRMRAALDAGPVLLSRATAIRADDTGGSLDGRLAEMGAGLLQEGLGRVAAGAALAETPQPENGITYARKLDKHEAILDFTRAAVQLERKVRAFNPWPVAETELAGERIRVWAAAQKPGSGPPFPVPGSVVAAGKYGIDVACGEGVLRILELQRPGGRVIDAGAYLNARRGLRP